MKRRIAELFHTFPPIWAGWLLVLVLGISFFLRVYRLDRLPYGFYEEEMTNTYVGRFIFLNGKDLYGNVFPLLYFDKFGDYPPILPLYLSGIGTFFLGVNEFAGRFPLALLGVLSSIPMFLLARRLFRSNIAGICAAFLLAVTPWHVVLSRTTAEGIVGFFTYLLGLFFVIRGIEERRRSHIVWAVFWFIAGYFLYPSLRILTPLTLLPFAVLPMRTGPVRRVLLGGLLVAVLLTGYITTTSWGRARFMQTSLFSNPDMAAGIRTRNELLSNGDGPNNIRLARTYHNKVVGYAREFVYQYVSYFSPKHLFLSADGQYRYYNVPDQGLLFLITLPLLGAILLGLRKPGRWQWYVVYLLAITPIPAALTVDFVPHVHRAMFMLVPLILLITAGFVNILTVFHRFRALLLVGFVLAVGVETLYFWHQYTYHADSHQGLLRNDGDREMIQTVIRLRQEYGTVIVPVFERLPLYYLFYTNNFSPALIGKFQPELRLEQADNVRFFGDWCPTRLIKPDTLTQDTLLVNNSSCDLTPGYREVLVQYRKDGTQSYRFYVPGP